MDKGVNCPVCGGNGTGKVGARQYYCHDCFLEFGFTKKGVEVYRLDFEGGLILVPPDERDRLQAQGY